MTQQTKTYFQELTDKLSRNDLWELFTTLAVYLQESEPTGPASRWGSEEELADELARRIHALRSGSATMLNGPKTMEALRKKYAI